MRWLKHILSAVSDWLDRKFPDQIILTPATFEHLKNAIEQAVAINRDVLELKNSVETLRAYQASSPQITAIEAEIKKLKDDFSTMSISMGYVSGRKPFER